MHIGTIRITASGSRSEEHTSELQSQSNIVCRLLLEKKKTIVVDGVFESVAPTNGQCGLILMGSRYNALPAAQLRLLILLQSGSLFGFLLAAGAFQRP